MANNKGVSQLAWFIIVVVIIIIMGKYLGWW